MKVISVTHFLFAASAVKSRVQQIGSERKAVFTIGCSCFSPLCPGAELKFSHNPCYPFSSAANTLSFQFCMNARTTINTPVVVIRIFNTLRKLFIVSFSLAFPLLRQL